MNRNTEIFIEQASKAVDKLSKIDVRNPAVRKAVREALEAIYEKTIAVDVSSDGFNWKDHQLGSGEGARTDALMNAYNVVKAQAPDVYKNLVGDGDTTAVPGSDLQYATDGKSIVVNVNGKQVGSVVGNKFTPV